MLVKIKGQGLSLNTVIIASIVLVVFVVLILIFTGGISPFIPQTKSCTGRQGHCDRSCQPSEFSIEGTDCAETGDVCCISRIDTDGSDCKAKGGNCGATTSDANLISAGREDCPEGEACWVDSDCRLAGGNCVEESACTQTKITSRCRYQEGKTMVCCK